MEPVSVREARKRRVGALVDAAERGESVVLTRQGKEVARIGPVEERGERRLPDLSDFRASIAVMGQALSDTVADLREAERF